MELHLFRFDDAVHLYQEWEDVDKTLLEGVELIENVNHFTFDRFSDAYTQLTALSCGRAKYINNQLIVY